MAFVVDWAIYRLNINNNPMEQTHDLNDVGLNLSYYVCGIKPAHTFFCFSPVHFIPPNLLYPRYVDSSTGGATPALV